MLMETLYELSIVIVVGTIIAGLMVLGFGRPSDGFTSKDEDDG